ncbi:hypothetical protein AYI69_g2514 [Smittium culicis]|uniref:SCP domain-containing protein n=1 Tax=Smittium culicis TaxID=133412 RepID=A0A1R1YM88_9FUNG|nr:hypothetical protein AYI69_g5777 [Smittium culicis]OMJ28031.1 hypothetical protein AYI69_g2514 [Smittium culicis]
MPINHNLLKVDDTIIKNYVLKRQNGLGNVKNNLDKSSAVKIDISVSSSGIGINSKRKAINPTLSSTSILKITGKPEKNNLDQLKSTTPTSSFNQNSIKSPITIQSPISTSKTRQVDISTTRTKISPTKTTISKSVSRNIPTETIQEKVPNNEIVKIDYDSYGNSDSEISGLSNDDLSLMLKLVNELRSQNNKPPLVYAKNEIKAARYQSEYQNYIRKMTHNNSNFKNDLRARITSSGATCKGCAENVAVGQRSTQQVFDAWKKSRGHFLSMIGNYKNFGYARVGRYWTQIFTS